MSLTEADCLALDQQPGFLAGQADLFAAGAPDTIYLDANSIGPMPLEARRRVMQVVDHGWRAARRRSWNETDWLTQPLSVGAGLSRILGARPEDLVVADSTTINQHRMLHLGLSLRAPRDVVVVQREVFPSNRHAAQAVTRMRGARLRDLACESDLGAALAAGDVAVVALSLVDYRSSERLDLAGLTALAHAHGALVLWDLSHAAGAVAVDLRAAGVDLAVGCGYKYLCGGPGAPAWLFVHPRHRAAAVWPALAGWMGHADTFAFSPDFTPADGIARHLSGTPPVLALAAFSAAAEIWQGVDPQRMDDRHRSLTDTLIRLIDEQCAPLGLVLASPREHARRGGHVALRFAAATDEGDAGALAQALVDAGVVVSSRKPDSLRLAPHPLVTRHAELWEAVIRLRAILEDERWRDARYRKPSV